MNRHDYSDTNPSTNPLMAAYLYRRGLLTFEELVPYVGHEAAAWCRTADLSLYRLTTMEALYWIDLASEEAEVVWGPPEYKRCALCREKTSERDQAEMYDPRLPGPGPHPSLIVHPDCGLAAGLEVA